MAALKGIHALMTSLFTLIIVYMTWSWVTGFFANRTDIVYHSILWASYIIMILAGVVGVPALIAFSEDSDASIASYLKGLGIYFFGVIVSVGFEITLGIFVGSATVSAILTEAFHIKIMTFLWVLAMALLLFVGPLMMAFAPNTFESSG